MGWAIVNVIMTGDDAVRGKTPAQQDLVRQVIADGYEPFSTAGFGADTLVLSFRKHTSDRSDDGIVSYDEVPDQP